METNEPCLDVLERCDRPTCGSIAGMKSGDATGDASGLSEALHIGTVDGFPDVAVL